MVPKYSSKYFDWQGGGTNKICYLLLKEICWLTVKI